MSSMRNAVQRRNHKERAQPLGREKWGLLEKSKDYKLRAASHRQKRAQLKALKEKASFRNPDEFYFGMHSQRLVDGGKAAKKGQGDSAEQNGGMSNDVVKLLKTQDSGYLRTVLSTVRRERERREGGLQIVERGSGKQVLRPLDDGAGGGKQSRHTVFVDDEEERNTFDAEEFFDTDAQNLGRSFNRPRRRTDSEPGDELSTTAKPPPSRRELEKAQLKLRDDKKALKLLKHSKEVARSALTSLRSREGELQTALDQLDLQRAKMQNNLVGVKSATGGKKFKVMERKR